jgi:hypothetical protein
MAANETVRVFSFWTDDYLLGARIRTAPEGVPSIGLDLAEGATIQVRIVEDTGEVDCVPWTQTAITNGRSQIKIDMDVHTARTLGAMLCAATLEDVMETMCRPEAFEPPMRISMDRQLRST